jgi:hypothetical protein
MFSAKGGFGNCLRLSCGIPWSPQLEQSLAILGSIAIRSAATNGQSRLAKDRRDGVQHRL